MQYGAYVQGVSTGGPAEAAGFEPGDIIVQIGDVPIDAQTTFSEALFQHSPGDQVDVKVFRDGDEMTLTITLGERPEDV